MTEPWPWPGDSRIERVQRIARSYREIALQHAPEQCAAVDARFHELGEEWIAPRLAEVDEDDWVTVDVAAAHTPYTVKTIYDWIYTERIVSNKGNDGRVRVQLTEVLDEHANRRRERASRRAG